MANSRIAVPIATAAAVSATDENGSPAVGKGQPQAQADHRAAPLTRSAPLTRPSRTTISRWAKAATRASWVTSMTLVFCSVAAAVNSSITCSPAIVSSDPVGSSANTTAGSVTRARATATRCA